MLPNVNFFVPEAFDASESQHGGLVQTWAVVQGLQSARYTQHNGRLVHVGIQRTDGRYETVRVGSKHKLAGVFALSSYVTNEAAVYKLIGKKAKEELPPVYMRHGAADDFILPTWGQGTSEQLASLGVDINFSLIPRLPHSLSPSELDELQQWLQERLALTS